MRGRVRAVWREEDAPARIVFCIAEAGEICRRIGPAAVKIVRTEKKRGRLEFVAAVHAGGEAVGMRAWGEWEDGEPICGRVIAFGLKGDELCGLNEEDAEDVRRYLDSREKADAEF